MNTDWNAIGPSYNRVRDARLTTVFPAVRQVLQRLAPARILDFGCGDGQFSVYCSGNSTEITNFDPAPTMRDAARRGCAGISNVTVVDSLDEVAPGSFDAVTMNAVWMCLPDHRSCRDALDQIRACLKPGGHLVASFTHPCFRMQRFATFHTDFDNRNYLKNGTMFQAHISDGTHSISVTDAHWNFEAVSQQLQEAGLVIVRLHELADPEASTPGSPWVILLAMRVK